MEVPYEDLSTSDLYIDCVYQGGQAGNIADEPFHLLIPGCENSGGFRKKLRRDGSGKYAYVVLYTSLEELEWPDYMDVETGVFRYYGDNRKPGRALTDTPKKGNSILEEAFHLLNSGEHLDDIPPFFIFSKARPGRDSKTGTGRDIKFLGLAAPGNPNLSSENDLVAFWRALKGNRFQNYETYFTVLDTGSEAISRQWISELITDHAAAMEHAPEAWKEFICKGRKGIKPLRAQKILRIPDKYDQLQSDNEGLGCLKIIRDHYKYFGQDRRRFYQGFEACAINLVQKMDPHFTSFDLTRPWRDGGRDAIGTYTVNSGAVNHALKMECSLEAKCYSENDSVGVKEMSRLISRIRYRQFGILVTTSYVDKQAYEEVVDDGHPILIVTAADIAGILRRNSIHQDNINEWLNEIDKNNSYLQSYIK